jgi:hypothetical protein
MSKPIFKTVILGVLFFAFATVAKAQNKVSVQSKDRNVIVVGASKTLEVAGKATVIVIKETAKIGWEVTKVTVGEIAAPTAKVILLKAAPKVSLFLLKKSAPIAARLAITAAL